MRPVSDFSRALPRPARLRPPTNSGGSVGAGGNAAQLTPPGGVPEYDGQVHGPDNTKSQQPASSRRAKPPPACTRIDLTDLRQPVAQIQLIRRFKSAQAQVQPICACQRSVEIGHPWLHLGEHQTATTAKTLRSAKATKFGRAERQTGVVAVCRTVLQAHEYAGDSFSKATGTELGLTSGEGFAAIAAQSAASHEAASVTKRPGMSPRRMAECRLSC